MPFARPLSVTRHLELIPYLPLAGILLWFQKAAIQSGGMVKNDEQEFQYRMKKWEMEHNREILATRYIFYTGILLIGALVLDKISPKLFLLLSFVALVGYGTAMLPRKLPKQMLPMGSEAREIEMREFLGLDNE